MNPPTIYPTTIPAKMAFLLVWALMHCIMMLQSSAPFVDAFSSPATSHKMELRWRLKKKGDEPSNEPRHDEITDEGMPPRERDVVFASPLLDYGYPPAVEEYENRTLSRKPLLLYLPGFDGTYISPFIQYPELSEEFDIRCMVTSMKDRSTFQELKRGVINYLQTELAEREQPRQIQSNTSKADSKGWFGGLFGWIQDTALGGNSNKTRNATDLESINGNSSFIKKKIGKRPVYLAGESFGGILASEVALNLLEDKSLGLKKNLQGLILINAATCYDRSQLASKGPPVALLPKFLYPFGLTGLLPLFTDTHSFPQLLSILAAKSLPSVIDTAQREAYMGRVAFSLPSKLAYMPQGTFDWRLNQWLSVGSSQVNATRLEDFQKFEGFRCLIVAGEKDLTLPSIAEAERLANIIPHSQVHVVDGAGHASTCGSRIDLTAVIRQRFQEIAEPSRDRGRTATTTPTTAIPKRTAMKLVAAQGQGPDFGMQPRYDRARIGLNPILYWSPENYKPTLYIDTDTLVS